MRKLTTVNCSKWVYMMFFAIFEIGSLVCAISKNSITLIIGRIIAGAGVSGLQNGSLTIVACSTPPHMRGGKWARYQVLLEAGSC